MFGNTCDECGEGTVRGAHVKNFEVKFDRMPFVVPDAVIGVCDKCGARQIHGEQYERWRQLFEEQRTEAQRRLLPDEIRTLRDQLGLTLTDFAALVGVTRQSLAYWESEDRDREQSRHVDLLLRLLRASVEDGQINVVDFLLDQCQKANIDIDDPRPHSEKKQAPVETKTS